MSSIAFILWIVANGKFKCCTMVGMVLTLIVLNGIENGPVVFDRWLMQWRYPLQWKYCNGKAYIKPTNSCP